MYIAALEGNILSYNKPFAYALPFAQLVVNKQSLTELTARHTYKCPAKGNYMETEN